jgi:hypothetical protein
VVADRDGSHIGHIQNLAIDFENGCTAYAVLSVEGTMQYDTKLLAVPWQVFSFEPETSSFKINIPRAKLENAPEFDRNYKPERVNDTWLDAVYNYYGFPPYSQR